MRWLWQLLKQIVGALRPSDENTDSVNSPKGPRNVVTVVLRHEVPLLGELLARKSKSASEGQSGGVASDGQSSTNSTRTSPTSARMTSSATIRRRSNQQSEPASNKPKAEVDSSAARSGEGTGQEGH